MDPLSAWTLVAFITVLSAGLLLLEVGMRRARGATGKRSSRTGRFDEVTAAAERPRQLARI